MFSRWSKPQRKGPQGEVLPEENEGLPDSNLPSGLCPRCGKQSSFENLGSLPVTFQYDSHILGHDGKPEYEHLNRVTSLLCRHCRQGVAVVEEQWIGDSPTRKGHSGGVITYRGINWWPLPEANLSPDVPSAIASVFAEATKALYANCPRASAVMARRTLEAITADKGETSGTLATRLQALAGNNVLHPTLADWAKEVRLVGNVGAHFDPIQKVSMEDAQQLLSFLRELLKYLYELPAELAKRRTSSP
jgi:hypothetical protein